MRKQTSQPIAIFGGFKIYASHATPKKKGKEVVWIVIRQDSKEFRVSESLCYVHGADIRFEKK